MTLAVLFIKMKLHVLPIKPMIVIGAKAYADNRLALTSTHLPTAECFPKKHVMRLTRRCVYGIQPQENRDYVLDNKTCTPSMDLTVQPSLTRLFVQTRLLL